jgi:hypothetical protein
LSTNLRSNFGARFWSPLSLDLPVCGLSLRLRSKLTRPGGTQNCPDSLDCILVFRYLPRECHGFLESRQKEMRCAWAIQLRQIFFVVKLHLKFGWFHSTYNNSFPHGDLAESIATSSVQQRTTETGICYRTVSRRITNRLGTRKPCKPQNSYQSPKH